MSTSPIAREIARLPGVAEALLAEHIADERGRCCGCTTPGTGTPSQAWPCTLHDLAVQARRVATGRAGAA
jgi:hypothetical protein